LAIYERTPKRELFLFLENQEYYLFIRREALLLIIICHARMTIIDGSLPPWASLSKCINYKLIKNENHHGKSNQQCWGSHEKLSDPSII